jgi:predicted transcriptional regulator
MPEKRERFDIIHDMLTAVIKNNNKIGPTKLIHLSNLSPAMFKEYTNDLTNNNLISEKKIKNKKFFEMTDKGYIFLQQYKTFRNFVEELGL